jgi:quercetin dioxygenase-like cupin family protein
MTQEHTYLKLHQISGPALLIDIEDKARGILEEARVATVGRAAETLAKQGPLRITIIGFTAGASMADHHAAGPVAIQVLRGQISVSFEGDTGDVGAGEVLVLEAGVRHSVLARTDAVILLSVTLP